MADSENGPADLTEADRGIIANALRFGGVLSFACLASGLLLELEGHPLKRLGIGDLLVHAGLVALLATPVVRILTAAWLYRRAGNGRFTIYCMISLAVIVASIAVGFLFRK